MACTCGVATGGGCPPGQQHLRYYYSGVAQGTTHSSYYDVCVGRCNPLACSNSACTNNIGCVGARNQFCLDWGKQCGSVKKCYGPQGQDPCPTCSFPAANATDANARKAILDYMNLYCGFDAPSRAAADKWLDGYASGRQAIINAWKACSLTTANQLIAKVANAVRCSHKCAGSISSHCDTNIPNCTNPPQCPGDPGGPSGNCVSGDPGTWGTCIGNWWAGSGGVCHALDFLPLGGCSKEIQTMLFVGLVGLGVIMLMKR